jgi:hypothetical protein
LLVASSEQAGVQGFVKALFKNAPELSVRSVACASAAGVTPFLGALFLSPHAATAAVASGIGGQREPMFGAFDYVYAPGWLGHGFLLKQVIYTPERQSSYTTNVTNAVLQIPVWFVNTDGHLGVLLSVAYGPREEVNRALSGASELAPVGCRKTASLYLHVSFYFISQGSLKPDGVVAVRQRAAQRADSARGPGQNAVLAQ